MTRLIGYRWKSREGLSRVVLINLFNFLLFYGLIQTRRGLIRNFSVRVCVRSVLVCVALTVKSACFYNKSAEVCFPVFKNIVFGASSDVETPDPIPNSAVKHFSADGSLQWQE